MKQQEITKEKFSSLQNLYFSISLVFFAFSIILDKCGYSTLAWGPTIVQIILTIVSVYYGYLWIKR